MLYICNLHNIVQQLYFNFKNKIIKRNEMEVFVMRWMELQSVIQSDVSQKEKNKYSMLTHIYGI